MGVVSVASAVAMIDRLPYAGLVGSIAAVSGAFVETEDKPAFWPVASVVAFTSCVYLFAEKRF